MWWELISRTNITENPNMLPQPNPELLEKFYYFIYKRQEAWHNRFKLGAAPPWSDDPVIATQKFTNIFRQLDRGTQYLLRYEETKPEPFDYFWNCIRYRIANNVDAHKQTGGWIGHADFDPQQWRAQTQEWINGGGKLFATCHMTCGYQTYRGFSTNKSETIANIIVDLHNEVTPAWKDILHAGTHYSQVFDRLQELTGYGPFLSYVVMSDLVYHPQIIPEAENCWAHCGPGATRGMEAIFGKVKSKDQLSVLQWLYDHQMNPLTQLGWDRVADQWVSIMNIENSLCEVQKYFKGGGFSGKFKPQSTSPY
jgi:hypothetical protein